MNDHSNTKRNNKVANAELGQLSLNTLPFAKVQKAEEKKYLSLGVKEELYSKTMISSTKKDTKDNAISKKALT